MSALRYVYAVCRPFDAPLQADLTGIGGAPVELLNHHGLVAVVGAVPEAEFAEEPLRACLEDLDWLTATARAHQGVIDALTTVTSPLPLRLATVFRDDSSLKTMLEQREDDLRSTLDRLDGRVEWGVKVYAEPVSENAGEFGQESGKGSGNESGNESRQGETASGRPMSGRDYLRQRRTQTRASEEMWRRAEEFADRLHTLLSARAEDSRLHNPQNPELSGASGRNVLNASYLVPRADSEEFVELVDRTKDEGEGGSGGQGLRVELTGPWACYSFTQGAEDTR